MENIQIDISNESDSPLIEIAKPKKDDVFEVTKGVLCVTINITVVYYFVEKFYFEHDLDETIVRLGSLEPLFIITSYLGLEFWNLILSKFNSFKNKMEENTMFEKIRRRVKERKEKREINKIKEFMTLSERAMNLPKDSELPRDTHEINNVRKTNNK